LAIKNISAAEKYFQIFPAEIFFICEIDVDFLIYIVCIYHINKLYEVF